MTDISSLAYVGIEAADPARWASFATDVLGAQVGDAASDGTQFIRFDEHAQRLSVHPGVDGTMAYIGWNVNDAQTLNALTTRLKVLGFECYAGSPEECAVRRVREFAWLRDPDDNRVELCYDPKVSSKAFKPSRPELSGFVGLGHAVVGVADPVAVERFYVDALGFRVTDYMEFQKANRPKRSITFLHCADGRNHSLAIMSGNGLDHLMVEVRDIDDVGRTLTLCRELDVPLATNLGRHSNDLMISFYLVSPSGLRIEYGCGGTYVDDASWQVRHLTTASLWGHNA